METIKYYCSLDYNNYSSSSEWASWFQAFLSGIAILATIYVVYFQKKNRENELLENSKFYSSGILVNIGQIRGALAACNDILEEIIKLKTAKTEDFGKILFILKNMKFPDKEDLIHLNFALPKSAISLLRIKNVISQIEHKVMIFNENGFNIEYLNEIKMMRDFIIEAELEIKKIGDELDKFVPE